MKKGKVLVGLVLVLMVVQGWSEVQPVSLRIAGSTIASNLVVNYNGMFSSATNGIVKPTYGVQQTGAAKALYLSNAADFVVSDTPLSTHEKTSVEASGRTPAHSPLALTGLAFTWHSSSLGISGLVSLNFTNDVLAGIYTGSINNWNDSAIAALNPRVTLPSLTIKPVIFDGQAGATYILTRYLSMTSNVWQSGASYAISLPNAIHQATAQSVVEAVRGTPGAFGYVPFAEVSTKALPVASLLNANGALVAPSFAGFNAAMLSATLPPGTDVWPDNLLLARPGAAYPISFFIYAIHDTDVSSSGASGAALGAWLQWAISPAPLAKANDYGFSPLDQMAIQVVNTTLTNEMTYATGTSPSQYWPYIAPQEPNPQAPQEPVDPPITRIPSHPLQIVIIVILVIVVVLVIALDNYRGGCIIKCTSTGRGVWA